MPQLLSTGAQSLMVDSTTMLYSTLAMCMRLHVSAMMGQAAVSIHLIFECVCGGSDLLSELFVDGLLHDLTRPLFCRACMSAGLLACLCLGGVGGV